MTKRSSARSQSERIATSLDVCCSARYRFFPAATAPETVVAARDVQPGTHFERVRPTLLVALRYVTV